jgi:hypothetical protein
MKTRSIILILATLIIGFILGMLISAQIRYQRLKPVQAYFSEERFRDAFYRTIQPDEKQKEKIDKILNNYARLNSELQRNFRKEFEANMEKMRTELDSCLTREQLVRVKEMDKKRVEMIEKFRKGFPNDSIGRRNSRWNGPEGGPMPGGPLPEGGPFPEGRPMPDRPSSDGFPPPPPGRDTTSFNHK